MPRCPNCNYILVLLENRRKYKCAKCGRLFLQKSLENRDFQIQNKNQREIDKYNFKLENTRVKLTEEQRKSRIKIYRLANKEKYRKYDQNYYYKNGDKILVRKKIYRQLTKQRNNEWRREYRHKLTERTRLLSRISFWRRKQKKLALQMFENELSEAYFLKI